MLLQTTTGNEIWPDGQTKVFAFLVPRNPREREQHLHVMAQAGASGLSDVRRVGNPQTTSAGIGLKAEQVGKWTEAVYDIPEGRIVRVSISRSSRGLVYTANMLLRVRQGAALRSINVSTIPAPRNIRHNVPTQGMFDMLSLAEARALGYMPAPAAAGSYNPAFISGLGFISVVQLERETARPAVAEKEVVTNADGQNVVVETTRKRRALQV